MLPILEDSNSIRGIHPQKEHIHTKKNKYISNQSARNTKVEEDSRIYSIESSAENLKEDINASTESCKRREIVVFDESDRELGYQMKIFITTHSLQCYLGDLR